jgi:hypothetical protein
MKPSRAALGANFWSDACFSNHMNASGIKILVALRKRRKFWARTNYFIPVFHVSLFGIAARGAD